MKRGGVNLYFSIIRMAEFVRTFSTEVVFAKLKIIVFPSPQSPSEREWHSGIQRFHEIFTKRYALKQKGSIFLILQQKCENVTFESILALGLLLFLHSATQI